MRRWRRRHSRSRRCPGCWGGWGGGSGAVSVAGGGGGLDGVAAQEVVDHFLGPAGGLFRVVAGLAEALGVLCGGGAALVGGDDVVAVAGGGVAPGGAAQALVAQVEVRREPVGGETLSGGQGDEVAGGVGVQPADPGLDVLGGAGDGLTGDLGGHGPPPRDGGRLTTGAEQAGVGDDDVHGDRHRRCDGLSGEALDQEVGHQLAPRPRVTLGTEPVGLLAEGDVGGDGLDHGQQPGEVGHRVRGGSYGDVAFGLGAAVSADDRGGVDGRDPAADQPDQGPGAETLDKAGAVGAGAAEVLIEAGAVRRGPGSRSPGR